MFNGVIRALAKAGVFGKRVTGIADGTDLETTERYRAVARSTRKGRIEDKRGKVHEIEVTVYGWKVLLLIDAVTKIPLAVKVVQIQEHEALWTRALVTQARTNLAGYARLHKVVFDQGFLAGTDLWWLDQQGIRFVVPAKDEHGGDGGCPGAQRRRARGVTVGRRVHTVRHGQGQSGVDASGWKRRWSGSRG